MPHLPLEGAGLPFRYEASPYGTGPYETGPYRAGRYDRPGPDRAGAADVATVRAAEAGPARREDPWHVMLRASGRISLGRTSPGPVL